MSVSTTGERQMSVSATANKHGLVVARRAPEPYKPMTLDELKTIINEFGPSPVTDVFYDFEQHFDVSYFDVYDNDSPKNVADKITDLIKKRYPFVSYDSSECAVRLVRLRHGFTAVRNLWILGAKGMKLDDINSFVAVVNKHSALVNQLRALTEEV